MRDYTYKFSQAEWLENCSYLTCREQRKLIELTNIQPQI